MVNPNRGLFSWSDVERRPELERLERVLKALPDEELLTALEPALYPQVQPGRSLSYRLLVRFSLMSLS